MKTYITGRHKNEPLTPSPMAQKIVSMTTMCIDYFPESGKMMPGGEALNFAVRAAKFPKTEVSLVGAVGDDIFGDKILSFLQKQNINTDGVHRIAGAVTANNRIYIDESGDRYFMEDSWTGGIDNEYIISESDEEIIKNADAVFTTCYSVNLKRIKEIRKKADFLLCVDFDTARDFEKLKNDSEGIDILMISGTEEMLDNFRCWSGSSDIMFNITLAEKGSVTFYKGNTTRVAAEPVEKVVDTTGCGDNYHAAFIASYLLCGDIQASMTAAGRAAAETLSGFGGAK